MAVGRQDYQAGVVPIKSGYSLAQTPFYKSEVAVLADGEDTNLCFEIVDVGYELCITGVRVSCNWPGIQLATYKLGTYWLTGKYYDLSFIDNFPEGSHLVVGGTLFAAIYVNNDTGEEVTYCGEIFGYIEQIES